MAVSEGAAKYGDILHECVACGAGTLSHWRTKRYQYTQAHSVEKFDICRCASCGTAFLNRPPHAEWLKEIYQYSGQALTQPITADEVLAREAKFPNCTLDAARMASQADRLNQSGNSRALDIGSGFGFYTQALRSVGYRTVSINPGKYENTVFKALNGDEPIPVMFESYADREPFGVVLMSQVLEHMLNPGQVVGQVSSLLTRGGVFACAVPNFNSLVVRLLGTRDNACLWVPEHVNYFTAAGLSALLEAHGLKVVKMEQTTRIPPDALSRRIRMGPTVSRLLDGLVVLSQGLVSRVMNSLGMGIYMTVYAVKQ